MDKQKFLATAFSLILLGISVMMSVNMIAEGKAVDIQANVQVEQSPEAIFY